MSESEPEKTPEESASGDSSAGGAGQPAGAGVTWFGIPRGAVAVVIVGLIASLGIYAIELRTSGSSSERDWQSIEPVSTPPAKAIGDGGSFGLARTTLSALPQNASGDLIFRVAGVVQVDSGRGKAPTSVRCDVSSTTPGDTFIARTTSKRSAWPRPSDDLERQEVPELSVAKFSFHGADVQELPIRDAFRRYTDSTAPTLVDWDFSDEATQTWIWTMAEGTGTGTATLGYDVIFRAQDRPAALIDCAARVNESEERIRVTARQQDWPLVDQASDEESADVSNVE